MSTKKEDKKIQWQDKVSKIRRREDVDEEKF